MRKKREQKKGFTVKVITNPKFVFFLAVTSLILMAFPLSDKLENKSQIDREIENLEREIAKKENKNYELENLIKYLQSDQFVEDQARTSLGFKKEGEEVVVIQEEGQVAGAFEENKEEGLSRSSEYKEPSLASGFERWWNYFFGQARSSIRELEFPGGSV